MGAMAGNCDVAVLGLSTMGSNLALNIADKGFQVAVYNRTTETTEKFMKANESYKNITACKTYDDLKAALKKPRRALILVQAGAATDATIEHLCKSFEKDDIIVDCGNARFQDQTRRAEELEAKGLRFLGMGISGGEEGARKGPAFFPGGTLSVWEDIKDVIEAAAAKASDGRPCAVMNGKGGAGSCVKMFHNAAEYAILQIWGEVYAILREWGAPSAKMADVLSSWKKKEGMGHKALLSSYMLDITVEVVKMADNEGAGGKTGGSLLVEKTLDWVGSKGTGLWSVQEALEAGCPTPSLAEAVISRQFTLFKEQRKAISKTIKLPSGTSYTDDDVEDLFWATALALISTYAQMFDCLRVLDLKFGFGLNLPATTSTFRAGCILQGYLLEPMTKAFEDDPNLPNLLCGFKAEIEANLPRCKKVMGKVVSEGSTGTPVFLASLSYIQMMATETIPSGQCVALQRDVFGRHGFKRVDKEGDFNCKWPELQ